MKIELRDIFLTSPSQFGINLTLLNIFIFSIIWKIQVSRLFSHWVWCEGYKNSSAGRVWINGFRLINDLTDHMTTRSSLPASLNSHVCSVTMYPPFLLLLLILILLSFFLLFIPATVSLVSCLLFSATLSHSGQAAQLTWLRRWSLKHTHARTYTHAHTHA